MSTITIEGLNFKRFISKEQIDERTKELGRQIAADYQTDTLLCLVVLNGAMIFASELMLAMGSDIVYETIRIKSYQGTASDPSKLSLRTPLPDVEGRDILIIEDIIDKGYTYQYLHQILSDQGAKSIAIASLLYKPDALEVKARKPKYYGFAIAPLFVVGHGLDYNEQGRTYPDIYQLSH